MIYFNQNKFSTVPYPSKEKPTATVASGGCGPTCAAMIVSNLTGQVVDPKAMALFAIAHGARVNGGTDMNILSKAVSLNYGLPVTTTNDENTVLAHLRAGGMAIANVGGNRGSYVGVLSDGGHYVVAAGIADDGRVVVLDPGYYNGKFNKAGRKGKVTVIDLGRGNYQCLCDISVLRDDTANRNPAYWLFKKGGMIVAEDWKEKIMQEAIKEGLIEAGKHNADDPAPKWFVLLTILEALKGGK